MRHPNCLIKKFENPDLNVVVKEANDFAKRCQEKNIECIATQHLTKGTAFVMLIHYIPLMKDGKLMEEN